MIVSTYLVQYLMRHLKVGSMKYSHSTESAPVHALGSRVSKRLLRPVLGCISATIMVSCASAQSAKAFGAALFQRKGCSHCHSIAGSGGNKAPDLSDVGTGMKAAEMERQMLFGGQNMPSFRDALTPKEVHVLVTFLSACHTAPATTVAQGEPASGLGTTPAGDLHVR